MISLHAAWSAVMGMNDGWLATHPNTALTVVLTLAIFAPGVITWLF